MDNSNEAIPGNRSQRAMLRERELAARWKTSQRTLQRWRAECYGPAWIVIGGSIRYRLSDVLDYEDRMRREGERS